MILLGFPEICQWGYKVKALFSERESRALVWQTARKPLILLGFPEIEQCHQLVRSKIA